MHIIAVLFLIIGLPAAFVAWYCVETYISSVIDYVYWIRVLIFLFSISYFGIVSRHIKPINNLLLKLTKRAGGKNRLAVETLFSLIPAVILMALAQKITQDYHNSLLAKQHIEVSAIVYDCYYLRKSNYCNYLFLVEGIQYENKFYNNLKTGEQSVVKVLYYPENPNINAIAESK